MSELSQKIQEISDSEIDNLVKSELESKSNSKKDTHFPECINQLSDPIQITISLFNQGKSNLESQLFCPRTLFVSNVILTAKLSRAKKLNESLKNTLREKRKDLVLQNTLSVDKTKLENSEPKNHRIRKRKFQVTRKFGCLSPECGKSYGWVYQVRKFIESAY